MGKKIESTKTAAKKPKKAAAIAAVITEPAAPLTAPPAETKPAKKTLKKTVVKKSAFTSDDVALRAYFIAEKRHKHGLPGDSHHDWIEAEKQLLAESRKKPVVKKAKKA